jgi:hypothetical protein
VPSGTYLAEQPPWIPMRPSNWRSPGSNVSPGSPGVAAELACRHALAPGHSEAEAADLIYVFMSPEIYRILTRRTRMGLETLGDMAGHDAPPGVAAGSEGWC